jgi:hypothetical protein
MAGKILFVRVITGMAPPALTSAIKIVAFIAAFIAMPLFLASGVAAVTEFSKELITVTVVAGLVLSIGFATVATTQS